LGRERLAEEKGFSGFRLRKEEGGCLVGSLWFLMKWAFLFPCLDQKVEFDPLVLDATSLCCSPSGPLDVTMWECCVRSSSSSS
jgi:hypothetical protein